ncbi:insulin-like growth factor-binding protein-like 1 isoform X2 [Ascaphus truei]|uniref:insulin-like growth factor-binding protein-like 1 isoform X2 n=1 Tax=Ascaphus truei TaxID=8439 RepID=UPI003F59BA8F
MQPFLFLLPLCVCVLQIPGVGTAAAATSACDPCNKDTCRPVTCAAPELLTKDECDCCERCLSLEAEECGGQGERRARCAPGMVCVSRSSSGSGSSSSDGTGFCLCEEDGAVCGSDGRSHSSVCALRLHSWMSLHQGKDNIHKVHDGECKFAPIIVVAPRKIHNVTGAQVYLSCEVKAVPTPSISWRKINPLVKEDEGTYQCHATNMVGETYADGIIKVTEHGKIRKTNHGGSESKV